MQRRRFVVTSAAFAAGATSPLRRHAWAQAALTRVTFTTLDYVDLIVERQGEGPSLFLIHGASGSHMSYARLVPLLTSSFTTFTLDRRGYGGSGGQAEHSMAREAEDIAAVINALPSPVYVFAHSSGAIETLEALRLMRNVRRAILYEPPFAEVGALSPNRCAR